MPYVPRRAFLSGAAALGTGSLLRDAQATLVKGLTLRDLVGQSDHVVLLTALDRESYYTTVRGQRTMVTDTRARVEDAVAKAPLSETEVTVRVFGGRVGSVAETVHGQAELALGRPSLTFLVRGEAAEYWTTGLAQGHYPLSERTSSEAILDASPHLPGIRGWQESAVRLLVGKALRIARGLVTEITVTP